MIKNKRNVQDSPSRRNSDGEDDSEESDPKSPRGGPAVVTTQQ